MFYFSHPTLATYVTSDEKSSCKTGKFSYAGFSHSGSKQSQAIVLSAGTPLNFTCNIETRKP